MLKLKMVVSAIIICISSNAYAGDNVPSENGSTTVLSDLIAFSSETREQIMTITDKIDTMDQYAKDVAALSEVRYQLQNQYVGLVKSELRTIVQMIVDIRDELDEETQGKINASIRKLVIESMEYTNMIHDSKLIQMQKEYEVKVKMLK